MKIHIVQKGDTLWKIAKQYNVNFEQLKSMNTQLSNPEMIMPGMKIKIPSHSSPAKHEGKPMGTSPGVVPPMNMPAQIKEEVVPPEVPLKAMPTVPVPVIEPDDLKPGVSVKPQMPMYEAPQKAMPKYEAPKYEVPKYQAPKYEAPKFEMPKYEAPKYEAPKYEAPVIPQPQIYQQPKIEFDMIQNQIYQQAQQQATQPAPVQQPCPTTQPQIQILPVYFYPIMPPVQHVQPPVQPPMPSPCEAVSYECSPCESGYGHHGHYDHGHHVGYCGSEYGHHMPYMHGGMQPWTHAWDIHGEQMYPQGMTNYPTPIMHRDDEGQQQANGQDLNDPRFEQAPELAAEQREPQERTYHESMPRYFDDQNLYSPHSLRYEESEQDENENSFDSANPSENPEQF